ncbi:hypothetical protein [Pseudidiomarina sp.]|uniref:hypothetical protein n=1 Tax=Pseudidiomarina sp. TaxID=2081707 RepID=UPI00299DEF1F|nr:hypothetical protein [Pseudidiomarina sp.]MDX1705067.1 hypothetical protein [Pseudidiomarina sp.]
MNRAVCLPLLLGSVLALLPGRVATAAAPDWSLITISPWQRALEVSDNLRCQLPGAVQVWLPSAAQSISLIHSFADWHQHPLADTMACFSARFYQPGSLDCNTKGERDRLECRLPLFPYEAGDRHLLFANAQGVASANDYQITLPLRSSQALIAHEIGHWLGLADEYQMTGELAEAFCSGKYDHASLNVAVSDTMIMSASQLQAFWQELPWQFAVPDWRLLGTKLADGRWRLGSMDKEQAGLFPVPACNSAGKYAWRPVAKMTAMHYHDTAVWPALYLELITRHR